MTITLTGANDAPTIVTGRYRCGWIGDRKRDVIGQRCDRICRCRHARHAYRGRRRARTAYRGTFAVAPADEVADSVAWTFAATEADLDSLQEGEVATQLYDVTVDDGHGGIAAQTVTITLTGANDAPTIVAAATDADGTVTEDATFSDTGAIAFTDVDILDLHTASFAAQGTDYRGKFGLADVDTDSDSVSWTFAVDETELNDLKANDVLTQLYDVTIDDGKGGTALQTVKVTINGANDAPDAVNDSHSMFEDTVATIKVLANDTDQDSDTLTVAAVGMPANGSATANADGTITYTPTPTSSVPTASPMTSATAAAGRIPQRSALRSPTLPSPAVVAAVVAGEGENTIAPSTELSDALEYYVPLAVRGLGTAGSGWSPSASL